MGHLNVSISCAINQGYLKAAGLVTVKLDKQEGYRKFTIVLEQ